LLKRVRHANVVEFYDAGEADGEHYIAMELVDGTSLAEVLRGCRRLGVPEAIEIATTVGRVLEFLHALQIVRCDIKPGNVLITREGRVLVTDLGTAKALGDVSLQLTKTEGPIGTPYYMAPEQFEGEQPDARVDLYALGVVLYEMLTGTRPFDEGSVMGTMRAHLERVPPPPSTMAPLPPRLDDIVMRAIARNPDQRFQTARAFVAALREVGTDAPADLLALVTDAWRQLSVDEARNEAKTEVVATLLGAGSPTLHSGGFGESTVNLSTPVTPIPRLSGSVPIPNAPDALPMPSESPTRSASAPPLASAAGSAASPVPLPPDPPPRKLGETREVSAPRPADTTSVHIPESVSTEAAAIRRPSRLVVVEGPDAGLSFALPDPGLSATVGRAGVSDIALSSSGLSRVHARLMRTKDGRCLVLDLNSRNGTFVDGTNALEPIDLEPGATITIADTTLRVEA
jgi:serine/threonine-protein kinase